MDALQDIEAPIAAEARRGRGAVSNASGRFEAERREGFDDGWGDGEEAGASDAPEPRVKTEVTMDAARRVISRNSSPDVPFDRSINPYRGCEHGCVYCFARPTHAFVGLSPGLDFETRLFAKSDAPKLLARELGKRGYEPKTIAIGTNTDPYQPIERDRGLMRGILEVLAAWRHPVTIITKGALIMRDIDILSEMAAQGLARVALSVTTLDHRLARSMEPRAATPQRRLEAVKALSQAKVPVGVLMAPVIPAMNDHEIEAVIAAAAEAGAGWANYIALRLPLEVKDIFRQWLKDKHPDRAERVVRAVRELHGGRDYDPRWGKRMRGEGAFARLIERRFERALRQQGLGSGAEVWEAPLRCDLFHNPVEVGRPVQLGLDI
ncbi:MAG: PA0069 family radical SAM protein [Rhodobacteraceae bacterium]|nr:PA0069 family radical SAM protein [Paracoccaceae bacterium]